MLPPEYLTYVVLPWSTKSIVVDVGYCLWVLYPHCGRFHFLLYWARQHTSPRLHSPWQEIFVCVSDCMTLGWLAVGVSSCWLCAVCLASCVCCAGGLCRYLARWHGNDCLLAVWLAVWLMYWLPAWFDVWLAIRNFVGCGGCYADCLYRCLTCWLAV